MGKLWKRLKFLRRSERFESEMEEELRFHLDMKTQDGVEAGLSEEDARFRMLRKSGSFTAMSLLGLSLGIALSTTVFAVVNALMQPLRQIKDPATCLLIT